MDGAGPAGSVRRAGRRARPLHRRDRHDAAPATNGRWWKAPRCSRRRLSRWRSDFPDKSVRSAHAVFSRAVAVGPPIELVLDVVAEGRSTATAVVAVHQNGRRCLSITVLADVPTGDVIRHHLPRPDVAAPADANTLRDADARAANCAWSTSSTSTAPTRSGRRSCTRGCTTTRSRPATTWPRRSSRTSPAIWAFRPPCARTRASVPARHT